MSSSPTDHLITEEAFGDLAAFTRLRRLTGLALATDGTRLVVTAQEPDTEGARYVSSVWEVPLAGGEPVRLTRSDKGESQPAFLPDGTLLFTSGRPDPDVAEDESALWALPPAGEARPYLTAPGGVGGAVVARDTGAVLLGGSRLTGTREGDDAARRTTRKDRKISAILHTGMPIRFWDHELGVDSPRLLHLAPGESVPTDLCPDAVAELVEADYSITADGATVASTWRVRRPHGRNPYTVVLIDVASRTRRVLAEEDGWQFGNPVIAPDGSRVAMEQEHDGTFDRAVSAGLALADVATGERVCIDLGDLYPREWAWSADSSTLFVTGDLHGRGAVIAVDALTATAVAQLASDAAYSALCPAPDGRTLYALRTTVDSAPTPVRLDTRVEGQRPATLPTPAPTPALPGTLTEVHADLPDGGRVRGWLCRPPGAEPAPVMLWIHGGPFGSWNAWSWRWNPWVAVAHGWAVLLPDPALSTGYGEGWVDRAWPYLADVVWNDLETLLDAALDEPGLDASRVACLGASFGGFMTNWIAGHTDRFRAIVTHAGLWALDQQHATTDGAAFKTGIFGRPDDHPEWYAAYSPHHSADKIVTPMLVCHGNRDYRVPVSEALRLWWDLVSRHDGDPATMPHRFLQLTGENHWVLSPANAEIWYDAVLGFCAEHVLGRPWTPSHLL